MTLNSFESLFQDLVCKFSPLLFILSLLVTAINLHVQLGNKVLKNYVFKS